MHTRQSTTNRKLSDSGDNSPKPIRPNTHNPQQTPLWAKSKPVQLQSLTVNKPNDPYEREAEQVANQVMQTASHQTLQRAVDETECRYERNERQKSRTAKGHLSSDVTRLGADRLLIADFGADWRHIKRSTKEDPVLKSWLSAFDSDDSYRLSITGYTDCVGAESANTDLRHARAKGVEELLGSNARSRVTFRGMAALGSYVNDNNTVENRAKNRSVVIEFNQNFDFEGDTVTVTPKRCGPDSTQWLIKEMNKNRNHPVIKTAREVKWPRYVPGVNLGWMYGFLTDFRDLVKAGAPWDYKSNQSMWRSGEGKDCPTEPCDKTVTLCGHCLNYDVPGNIHYGWIGRQGNIRPWILHDRASAAQKGGVDDPKDTVAIDIGIAMADKGATLCGEIGKKLNQLNLQGTEDCHPCSSS